MRRLCALACLLSACGDTDRASLAIHDPLDLIDDVEGPLRLFVLPADRYTCDALTGAVSPEVPDVAEGMVDDAVADVSLTVSASMASTELDLAAGDYTVLVRGKGTDPVTMIPDVFIATGCAATTITANETVELRIALIPIVGMGECGDGTLSPDEQCEDSNTASGDGCSSDCRTERFDVSTTAGGDLERPRIGGAAGQRWTISYDSGGMDTLLRILEPDGATVTSPSVLMMDTRLRDAIGALVGVHLLSSTAVSSTTGRIGVSFTQFSAGSANVRVAFFDRNRNVEAGGSVQVRGGLATAAQPTSSVALAGDDAMVVLEDSMSATGISGQIYPDGTTAPIGADPFEIGQGTTLATDVVVAAASDHFIVAFAAGGDVFVQRFGSDGAARDAAAINVLEDATGTQDQPAIAALSDGRFVVAWRDTEGDGDGTSIRARAYTATAPVAAAFVVETSTGGDQSAPAVAAGAASFALVWQSGSALRARLLANDGTPITNHERPPTTADFEVGSGGEVSVAAGGPSASPLFFAAWNEGGTIRGRVFPLP